jgi:transposase-like protein
MKSFLAVLTAVFALGLTAQAVEVPINEQCPVCKKDARLIFYTKTKDGRVAFATKECKAKFDKSPGSFKVVKADKK